MTDILDDEQLTPPGKPDFRRVSNGVPFVLNPEGKRVRYGRPSNVGKILDDESNLVDWKLRTTVVGAAQRPDLMAVVSTLNPAQDKKQLRAIAEDCLVSGKGMERTVKGTAVHSMFDHIDNGDDWEPAPQFADLCNAYREALDAWGLVPIDVEVHCINDEFHLAGSMDRRYRTTKVLISPDGRVIPIGSVIAADTKTGQVVEYASGTYATQLAAYVGSQRYDVNTDERFPFVPPTYEEWGLIVHADSGGSTVAFYWVDLNAGREGLQLAQHVKQWRQRSDLLTLGTTPPVTTAPVVPLAPPVVPVDDRRTASLHQYARDRVRAVLAHSEAAGKLLQQLWPKGIPGLKQEGHTFAQLQDVLYVVAAVEFDKGVPTFPDWVDPQEEAKKRHPASQPRERPAPVKVWDRIREHPRGALLQAWVGMAQSNGIDESLDTTELANAMLVFASIDTSEWPTDPSHDEALSQFLDGTLRALGYAKGIYDLGYVSTNDAYQIMNAAEAIEAGEGMLVYGEDGLVRFRMNVERANR